MRVAVVGCLHGELDKVYEDIKFREQRDGIPVDVALVCGDFQSVRNHHDLKCMAVPPKYRQLGQFHDYYYGRKKAPILTLFVGGNHEASNFLSTLSYGGWVAENIFYLGYASVINFGGLRIGGISGIYKKHDAHSGHYEKLPYDNSSLRSVFHVRDLEIHRMKMISSTSTAEEQPLDILLTHDWPLDMPGNATREALDELLRRKPFFRQEVEQRCLGNPFYEHLMKHLRPRFWFSAHLHVKFEVDIDFSDTVHTKFLALDKCLPRRRYLEILDINAKTAEDKVLSYDAEWLAILRKTNYLLSVNVKPETPIPAVWTNVDPVSQEEIDEVVKIWSEGLAIPRNFTICEPALVDRDIDPGRTRNFPNPQTTKFCAKNNVTDPIAKILATSVKLENPDEISLDDEEDVEEKESSDGNNKKLKTDADKVLESGAFFVIDKIGM